MMRVAKERADLAFRRRHHAERAYKYCQSSTGSPGSILQDAVVVAISFLELSLDICIYNIFLMPRKFI